MKCTPNCAPGGALSKIQTGELLWRDTGGIYGKPLRLDTGRILARIHRQGILSGVLGGIHWRAILGGIHWQAALVGYSAASSGELL